MSVYGYFVCHDCRQTFWLGKALHRDHHPFAFHIGNEEPKHWHRPELNKVLWKFLADHTSHRIAVLMEHEMTDDMFTYQSIGGDPGAGISETEFLKDPSGFYDEPAPAIKRG